MDDVKELKHIRIDLSVEEHAALLQKKGGRRWIDVLRDGANVVPAIDGETRRSGTG
jgi:hypothetical protein